MYKQQVAEEEDDDDDGDFNQEFDEEEEGRDVQSMRQRAAKDIQIGDLESDEKPEAGWNVLGAHGHSHAILKPAHSPDGSNAEQRHRVNSKQWRDLMPLSQKKGSSKNSPASHSKN